MDGQIGHLPVRLRVRGLAGSATDLAWSWPDLCIPTSSC